MILAAMLSATGLLSTGPEPEFNPDPEPSEPVGTPCGPKIDALLAMPSEMWTQRGAKRFDRAFAELAKTTASAIAHALPRLGFPDVLAPGMKIPSDAPAASLMLFWPCETRALQRPRFVVLELVDNHVAVDGLGWRAVVIHVGETRMKITHGASIDDVIRFLSDLRVQRQGETVLPLDPWRDGERGIEIGEHLPTQIARVLRESHDVPDGLTMLPAPPAVWRQGNSLGKTSVDMRNLLDGITSERRINVTTEGLRAFGVEASRASEAVRRFSERMAEDIPTRAAEPYKPAHASPRKVAYVPFYTPAEQAEHIARAKAKKAKRKSAQASKRRNRS